METTRMLAWKMKQRENKMEAEGKSVRREKPTTPYETAFAVVSFPDSNRYKNMPAYRQYQCYEWECDYKFNHSIVAVFRTKQQAEIAARRMSEAAIGSYKRALDSGVATASSARGNSTVAANESLNICDGMLECMVGCNVN